MSVVLKCDKINLASAEPLFVKTDIVVTSTFSVPATVLSGAGNWQELRQLFSESKKSSGEMVF